MSRLSDYIRRESKFLRAEDLGEGNEVIVEIVSEVRKRTAFGKDRFEVDVRLPDGSVKVWTINFTSLKRLIDAYGDDTVPSSGAWKGRKVRLVVQRVIVTGEEKLAIFGYPLGGGEEEAVKQFLLKDVRSFYPDRIDLDTLGRLMRSIRGFKTSPEEAAKMAGLRIVEEGGKKFVVFKA